MTMSPEQIRALLIVIALTVISGFGDSQGFLHSAKVWREDRIVWEEVAYSAASFGFGIAVYWVSIRFYQRLGVSFAETQTIFWFAVTIIGVAVLSGKFAQWGRADQFVALGVLAGVGWLLFRTGG
ncbi:MAG TPA: hypothetical protein VJ020_03215 [Anaerolineales bacterium]|nr:hypothetical protein [Anaerolineales bacterium]